MIERTPVRLLLIEDSPTDAILFRQYLGEVKDVSFDLHHCDTLGSGTEQLSLKHYDAIVLDLNLPDSSGLATFETLHQGQPDMPIIILTGDDDRAVSNEALRKGADNYLLKNYADGNRIAIAILSAIRNHGAGVHTFSESGPEE